MEMISKWVFMRFVITEQGLIDYCVGGSGTLVLAGAYVDPYYQPISSPRVYSYIFTVQPEIVHESVVLYREDILDDSYDPETSFTYMGDLYYVRVNYLTGPAYYRAKVDHKDFDLEFNALVLLRVQEGVDILSVPPLFVCYLDFVDRQDGLVNYFYFLWRSPANTSIPTIEPFIDNTRFYCPISVQGVIPVKAYCPSAASALDNLYLSYCPTSMEYPPFTVCYYCPTSIEYPPFTVCYYCPTVID